MSEKDEKNGMAKMALGAFLLILFGSLAAAVIGGGFAAIIALVSPEFVKNLFFLEDDHDGVVGYAFSVGMIWGLFLGIGVSCFACLLTAVVKIIRLRVEHRSTSVGK